MKEKFEEVNDTEKQEPKEKMEGAFGDVAEFIIEKELHGQEGFVIMTHGNILSYRKEKDQESLLKNMEKEYIKDGDSEEEANDHINNDWAYFQIVPVQTGKTWFSFVVVKIFDSTLRGEEVAIINHENGKTTMN
jgi:hypothetical protein